MNEKELREIEDSINLPFAIMSSRIRALTEEVRRLQAVLAEYADRGNWELSGYAVGTQATNFFDWWLPDEHGYTRAENALKDGQQ